MVIGHPVIYHSFCPRSARTLAAPLGSRRRARPTPFSLPSTSAAQPPSRAGSPALQVALSRGGLGRRVRCRLLIKKFSISRLIRDFFLKVEAYNIYKMPLQHRFVFQALSQTVYVQSVFSTLSQGFVMDFYTICESLNGQ